MSNIVITTTEKAIKIIFNSASSDVDLEQASWNKTLLQRVEQLKAGGPVYFHINDFKELPLVFEPKVGCYIVDSVDGVAPSSNDNLFELMSNVLS